MGDTDEFHEPGPVPQRLWAPQKTRGVLLTTSSQWPETSSCRTEGRQDKPAEWTIDQTLTAISWSRCSHRPIYRWETGGFQSGSEPSNCISLAQNESVWLFCDPMDCSPSGSSVHGILQARILEWVFIPFSRGSSWSRDQTQASCIAGRLFTIWATNTCVTSFFNNLKKFLCTPFQLLSISHMQLLFWFATKD